MTCKIVEPSPLLLITTWKEDIWHLVEIVAELIIALRTVGHVLTVEIRGTGPESVLRVEVETQCKTVGVTPISEALVAAEAMAIGPPARTEGDIVAVMNHTRTVM